MADPWATSASASLGTHGTVTLVEGSAFCISGRVGNMHPTYPEGLFFRDTRFLSRFELLLNGGVPEPLSATPLDPFSAAFVLRDQPGAGKADSHLVVFRHRYVGRGMREDILVRNFGNEAAFCSLELHVDCDFADIFEVKEMRVLKAGELSMRTDHGRMEFTYERGTFRRSTVVDFSVPPHFQGNAAAYEVIVPAGGEWSTCVQLTPVIDGEPIEPRYRCGQPVERAKPVERLEEWRRRLPVVDAEHDTFRALLDRSTEDLAALRLFDPEHPERVVVAAGAPWFMTLFGRDSLLTSWMAMMADPHLALGTLQTLARYQGKDVNPLTEEEPGRILHEMRVGETAELSLGGGRVYYGTADATPLFVMLLGELARWGYQQSEVDTLLPAADRALEWIEHHGDRDGDGYVEYERTSDRGLRNQGWKDSWDGVNFADGVLAEPPIALCEVQAYVYGAYVARSHFATEHGDLELAEDLRKKAQALKEAFNRDFWLEEHGWFAIGLDREKRPVDALASNMGHCLWTGIVDTDKARVVADRLVSDELFSGWGVRTIASSMSRFNPISYHNGSVWPHDNAIAAAGLMRYGFVDESHRVMEGLISAAPHFDNRLPELFAGFSRSHLPFPVSYPTSCSPQAWAAATPLLFLRTMLRLEPDIRNAELRIAPAIPEWAGRIRIDNMPFMGGELAIEVEGEHLRVTELPEGLSVVHTPRRPTL
ncbi:MAG TPA: glycogen debranching N-terminal domain-containing protein [Acidimicrobiia bacterium]|nr:glycogen debranching N-terminal domain-containing protein [Acidimicrobiia bacterium]